MYIKTQKVQAKKTQQVYYQTGTKSSVVGYTYDVVFYVKQFFFNNKSNKENISVL